MATSGSFTTTSYEGRSLTFSWNRTSTNIANNTSTIAWSVTGSGSYTYGWVTCGDIDVVINGTTVYNSSAESRVNVWSGTVVASGTTTISHNADGAKSFSASVNAAIYTYAQNCSGSGTFTLDTIPRASSIDKVTNTSGTSISTISTGNAIRVYFTPKSTAFKYRVTVSMNGQTYQNNSAGVSVTSTAQTYYQPAAIPHTWLPNSTSGTLTCKLETLNGTTVIGTSTKTISMTVPASIVPTLGAFSSTPYNTNSVISGWGIYVTNYTKARLACTASGSGGSTIKSFQISGASTTTVNGTSLSYDASLTSGGSKTFTVVAVDSRGRISTSKSVTINVVNYYTPSISSFDVIRTDSSGNSSDNGTSAKLSFSGSYSNIGSNASTATFSYKLSTATAFTTLNTTVDGSSGKFSGGIIVSNISFSTANEYDFKIQISDSMGNTVSRTVRLGTVTRTMNVAKYGNGVAIGKMSTVSNQTAAGKFEVGWDADFDKNVNIDGKLTLVEGLSSPLPITSGGTGATTAEGIANTHYHTYISNSSAQGGTNGYVRIATIKVNGANVNQCIEIDFIRRGDPQVTTISILFQNTSSNDPSITNFRSSGPARAWIYKVSTSTWGICTIKTEYWDNISILSIRKGSQTNNVSVTSADNFSAGLPTGAIEAVMTDFIVEQGNSGVWTYRKWNSGLAECWGVYTMLSACTKAWGALYYSDTLAPRINYPFTFKNRPQETVFCRGDSISAWAYPEGGGIGMNTTTQTAQYGFLRPTTMTSAQVNYEYTVVGRWK